MPNLFDRDQFERLLPDYLSKAEKGRLLDELAAYLPNIEQIRLQSLDYFGYYLFLVKLSYHFCRLPEEKQR